MGRQPHPSPPISLTEYAKRRGVSKVAVSKAIKSGRLKASVIRDERGQPKIRDPELADREWAGSTDLTKAPGYVKTRGTPAPARGPGEAPRAPHRPAPPPAGPAAPPPGPAPGVEVPAELSLAEETARKMYWQANQAELEYREHVGELVDAKQLQADLADCFTRVRTKLLGIPARARQRIPHLSPADVGTIDGFVREALEELVLELEHDAGDDDESEAA